MVDVAGFGETQLASCLALRLGSVDLERAGDEHVVTFVKSDVEAGLYGKT
jgi:hypothetical protein